jgi:hypothetical protein
MSTHPGWKRATQVKLIAELQGFWAEDLWDTALGPKTPLPSPGRTLSSAPAPDGP